MLKHTSVFGGCAAVMAVLWGAIWGPQQVAAAEQSSVSLGPGVKAVWGLDKAYREITPTRERIGINGLWQWQPAANQSDRVPQGNWGYFKVPGCWPGITDYMQKDSQTVYLHPAWKDITMRDVTMAWYQREITIPDTWNDRRMAAPVRGDESGRWLNGFYLDEPEAWDDPYRFFQW